MGAASPLKSWPDVPTRVLLCRDDRLFPAGFIRRVARERLGITPDEIDGGHTPALAVEGAGRVPPGVRGPRRRELRLTPCARDCGCRYSRSLPIRVWSQDWPPRRRNGVGTGSSCGISSAGVSRSGRWPIRGSPWRRSPLPPSRRLGPMVTPLARRRPAKVARETASLDVLSGGRLILGVGLGADRFAGSSRRPGRSSMIGCAARCSTKPSRSLWPPGPASPSPIAACTTSSMTCSSCPGRCTCRGYRCGPRRSRDTQAAAPRRTLRRLLPGRPRERGSVRRGGRGRARLRGDNPAPYDIAVELSPGSDVAPYAEAGATWWMTALDPGISLDEVRGVIREGPAG